MEYLNRLIEDYEYQNKQLKKKLTDKNKKIFREIDNHMRTNIYVIANLDKEVSACHELKNEIDNIDKILADLKYLKYKGDVKK